MGKRTCSVEGCDKPQHARELCGAHDRRLRVTGDVQAHIPLRVYNPGAPCSVEGCDRKVHAKSLCQGHDRRRREGMDLSVPFRRFDPGQSCEVDGCDKPVDARGLCKGHWCRLRKTGEIRPEIPLRVELFKSGEKCAREDCSELSDSLGLCKPHWRQKYRAEHSWVYSNAEARRRARLTGAAVEVFDRREVFDRDGWICRICDQPVDQELQYPEPASVSLDHIAPLSLGGEHARANCQTAHLICNIRKGARVDGDFGERASA